MLSIGHFTQHVRGPRQRMGRVDNNASMAGEAVNTNLVIDAANGLRHVAVQEIRYREDDDGDKGDDSETPD